MESLADIEVCIEAHTSLYRRLSYLYTGDRVRCATSIHRHNLGVYKGNWQKAWEFPWLTPRHVYRLGV